MSFKHFIDYEELDDSELEDTTYFQIVGGTQGNGSGVRRGSGSQSQAREGLRQSSSYSTTTVYQEVMGRDEGSYRWFRVEHREDGEDTEGGNIFSKLSKADDKRKAAFVEKTSAWMQKYVNSAKQQQSDTVRSLRPSEEMMQKYVNSTKQQQSDTLRSSRPPEEMTGPTEGQVTSRKMYIRKLSERLKRPKHSGRGVDRGTTGKSTVVQATLDKFRELLGLMESEVDSVGQSKRRRVDMQVASHMREMKWSLDDELIGEVEGVEAGDGFDWRAEMYVIGLHKELIAGIHVVKRPESEGGLVATSVVFSVSSSYSDNVYRESGPSIYSGEGGMPSTRGSTGELQGYHDQTLTRGNLALKRSAEQNVPIRVIKGVKRVHEDDKRYVYDGLYKITECRYETGVHGNKVYKFVLNRLR